MKMKYQGFAIDRLGYLKTRKTRFYATYYDAYQAAQKLCRKWLKNRGYIDVESTLVLGENNSAVK